VNRDGFVRGGAGGATGGTFGDQIRKYMTPTDTTRLKVADSLIRSCQQYSPLHCMTTCTDYASCERFQVLFSASKRAGRRAASDRDDVEGDDEW